ncbi:MAG: putative integral membrane protein [Alphaproteobacteria bacterium]|jgi:uncharacterized integral membrane protein
MTILSHLLFQVFIFIGLVVGGFLVFQNTSLVTLTLGKMIFLDTPLWLVLFSSFFIGAFVGYLLHFNRIFSKKL